MRIILINRRILINFMRHQIPLNRAARAETSPKNLRHSGTHEVASDLAYKRLAIVNFLFFGPPAAPDRQWVLIDAGMPGTAGLIARAATQRFGHNSRPSAIILTHGHFDHVGGLKTLAERWDTPIYAHPLEFPFLNGTTSYPPPDPTVGGGLMAALSPMYPRGPIDVSLGLMPFPKTRSPACPAGAGCLPRAIPRAISRFWRESDRTLIAGDAFITTNQESAYSVAVQRPELHGPPMYYTPDWPQARESVQRLAELEPELVVTGHGPAMRGPEMRAALHLLAHDFDRIAVPEHGRYVPATDCWLKPRVPTCS